MLEGAIRAHHHDHQFLSKTTKNTEKAVSIQSLNIDQTAAK